MPVQAVLHYTEPTSDKSHVGLLHFPIFPRRH